MCELFGFSSVNHKRLNEYLKEFYSHCPNHPNGWGLAEFHEDSVDIHTEPVCADKSLLLPRLLEKDISSKTVLAHIRRATVGNVLASNCHPFVLYDNSSRQWTLIHNGTIFSGLELLKYQKYQKGETDSERILMYLIDELNAESERKGCELNSYERFKVVENVVEKISYRNKLNLIIYDGEQLYAHVNMQNTLYAKASEGEIMIATVPLDEDSMWEALPLSTLLVYRSGDLLYKGKNHHNEYIDVIGASLQKYEYHI